MQIGNTNETYYVKFDNEVSRKLCVAKWSMHEYYIEHFTYERENGDKLDYMLGLTLGNYFGQTHKVVGQYIPVPIYGNTANTEDIHE